MAFTSACDAILDVNQYMNEAKRDIEMMSKISEIERTIVNLAIVLSSITNWRTYLYIFSQTKPI